jgi:hypothetical protein
MNSIVFNDSKRDREAKSGPFTVTKKVQSSGAIKMEPITRNTSKVASDRMMASVVKHLKSH